MSQQRLTDRSLAPYITGNTLIHIVNPDDQTQYIAGSSYKATMDQVVDFLSEIFISSDYWVSGSSGNYSLKTINDSGLDATGNYALAEGYNTLSSGLASHAEGLATVSMNSGSHAEGSSTTASGTYSHAEGLSTSATTQSAHAEGSFTLASGPNSHAGGNSTIASGITSFVHSANSVVGGDNAAVLGGINHNIDNTSSNSSILGGSVNTIDNSINGVILGGSNNLLFNGIKSSITGGESNTITGYNNIIGSGSGNTINTNNAVIAGGTYNQIPSAGGFSSSIVGGTSNEILNANSSFIGGGSGNTVSQNASLTVIGGGYNNKIGITGTSTINGQVSVIVGGGNNYISSGGKGFETTYGFIGGGSNNYLIEGTYSFIGSGALNRITGTTSTIVGGAGNKVKGLRSFIGGGDSNKVYSTSSSIIGGDNNIISGSSDNTTIVGGDGNINRNNRYGSIIGGRYNQINPLYGYYQPYNFIGSGYGNKIDMWGEAIQPNRGNNVLLGTQEALVTGYGYRGHNTIIGTAFGWDRQVDQKNSSVIDGGSWNVVLGGSACYEDRFGYDTSGVTHGLVDYCYRSTIINGYGNLQKNTFYSTIIGGYKNYIGENTSSSIIGSGYGNVIDSKSQYTNILNGIGNGAYFSRLSSIIGGSESVISGISNSNKSIGSTIIGGDQNLIRTDNSTINGGYNNISNHNETHIIGSNIGTKLPNVTLVNSLNVLTLPQGGAMKTLGVDSNGIVSDDNITSLSEFTGDTNNYYLRIAGNTSVSGFASNTISKGGFINDTVQSNDGSIYLVGSFSYFAHYNVNNLVKLTKNGEIDTSFTSYMDSGIIRTVDVQSDGKPIIGGDFITYSGQSKNRIVRLNTDGTIDGTFTIGTGFNSRVSSIKIQSDGKIVVGGYFTTYNGTPVNRIVRLNTDGTIDGTFIIGTGFNNIVNRVFLQIDGKVLVGGNFTTYNGTGRTRLARLNTNGTIDGTFTVGGGFNNQVLSVIELSDNSILAGGLFTTYDGNSANYITKLDSSGTIDSVFSATTGFNYYVYDLIEDSDNKYLVGGQFTSYSGQSYNSIVRLETNGSVDTSFISTGQGFKRSTKYDNSFFAKPIVYNLLELNNNTYLVGGNLLNRFVNSSGLNVRANHYNIDKNSNLIDISYYREEYKTSVANVLGGYTGNTSGTCITDLFVSNIHSCSPLNINPLDEGNVYFGSTSGVTIDLANNRLGINIDVPTERLHVEGGDLLVKNTNGQFYTDIQNATGPATVLSGNTTGVSRIGVVVPTYDSVSLGVRGPSAGFSGYGKQGDAFIYSSNANNGFNVISQPGTGTDDYIRFFAGQASGAAGTPDIHIQGSGSTRGFVGFGLGSPTSKVDITTTNGYQQLRLRQSYTPTSTADTNGNVGDVAWDDTYFYIKTNTGWGRLALDYVF